MQRVLINCKFTMLQLFRDAISAAVKYKKDPTDWQDQVLSELEQATLTDMTKKDLIENETRNNESNGSSHSQDDKQI